MRGLSATLRKSISAHTRGRLKNSKESRVEAPIYTTETEETQNPPRNAPENRQRFAARVVYAVAFPVGKSDISAGNFVSSSGNFVSFGGNFASSGGNFVSSGGNFATSGGNTSPFPAETSSIP